MSFSYTVGGKSLTHTKKGNQGQNRNKGTGSSKPSKDSSLSSVSDIRQREGQRHTAGEQPGSDINTSPNARKTTRTSKPIENQPKVSNIVTLSDLQNHQNKANTDLKLKEVNKRTNNSAIANKKSGSTGRKLGGIAIVNADTNSNSFKTSPISTTSGGVKIPANKTSSTSTSNYSTPLKSENLDKNHNSKTIHSPSDKRTSKQSRFRPRLSDAKTSPSRQTSVRGRGTQSVRRGMASNSGYTSSSLYSANPRPVGQRRPGENGSIQNRQQQGTSTEGSQGSPQQNNESSGSYRVIPPNPSKREKLLNDSQQELKAYEDHMAAKKPPTIHGAPKSTGGSKSEEEARRALEKQNQNKKYEQIIKKEKQRKERREQEDKEYDEKKYKARRVAEENERKREERAANYLREDHAKTNEDFLRRVEMRTSPQSSGQAVSQSSELRQLMEMFPKKTAAKLQELLDMTNNDVEKVINLLVDN